MVHQRALHYFNSQAAAPNKGLREAKNAFSVGEVVRVNVQGRNRGRKKSS